MSSLSQMLCKPALAERRSTLRLYKIWDAVRGLRDLPLLTNFDLSLLERFGGDCFLLDFESNPPMFRYLGRNLAAEIGRDLTGRPVTEVPRFSLLAHVVAKCIGAATQRKAIGLSGSFFKAADQHLLYRGILLPFSTDGDRVDAFLGFFRSRQEKGSTLSSAAVHRAVRQPEVRSASVSESNGSPPPPVATRAVVNRARQLFEADLADEESRPSGGRRLIAMISGAWCRAIWPHRVVTITKDAPAIGKAILAKEVSSEFVLMVGRRVEAGRIEVVSSAHPVLLNLAMRLAARKLARRSTNNPDDSARIPAARFMNG